MSGGKNCYPGSDVLINKYNIHDKELLEKLEIQKITVKLLGLDAFPERIKFKSDIEHLISINCYLFEDIYEWAGSFRTENLYKPERVLSGGSAEYCDYHEINVKLKNVFEKYKRTDWNKYQALEERITDFLLELWSIHPFREGNTRTCITFLWHYLQNVGIDFKVELLRNNPMYVRDSLVMANYDQKEYLRTIISDALHDTDNHEAKEKDLKNTKEQYQISKTDYDTFKEKYSVKKKE